MQSPERILVLGYRHLGDALFLTPMLRAVRRRFPAAHVAVTAYEAGAAALETNPHVDRILRLTGRGLTPKYRLLPDLRRERFDTFILGQHSLPDALLGWLTGCRTRVGRATHGCGPLLTVRVHESHPARVRHEAERYLDLAEALGAEHDGGGLEFHPAATDRAAAAVTLARHGLAGKPAGVARARPLVGIFPGSSRQWDFKRWPAERFAAVGRELVRHRGADVLVLAGPADRDVALAVSGGIDAPHACEHETRSLGQFAALLAECDLVVSNDSGPMHLATAVGTRVVDLAGPSDPRRTGPFGPGHIVVQKVDPREPRVWANAADPTLAIRSITVDDVLGAVATVLG